MEDIASIVDEAAMSAKLEKKRNLQEIAMCDYGISVMEERKQRLVLANREYHLIASLKYSGASAWNQLTSENKWKKENVLAVFLSGKIPAEFHEGRFQQSAPETIREDREVLLARLAREDFADFYYDNWTNNVYRISERIESNPFRIPEPLLADTKVVAAVVNRYPEILMQHVLPAEVFDDTGVFRAYVNSKRMQVFTSRAAFIMENLVGKFSERIRENPELMLEAAGALKYAAAVYNHFSASLEDDSSFALRLVDRCEAIPDHALSRFSDGVRSDPAAVLAFVRKNGLCLKDASEALRQNEEIVREACKNHSSALRHCAPGPTKRRLGGDKSFMLDIFAGLRASLEREPRLWKMLSPPLKHDRDLVVAAQASKSLVFADLPEALTSDPDFWMDVIMRDSSFWFALPEKYEDDPSFVRAIKTFESEELVFDVFDRFSFLTSDRDVWTTIIDSSTCDAWLPDLIGDYAPEQIRLDKDLMACACTKAPAMLKILSSQLRQDREIVEATVEVSDDALPQFPKDLQCMYPDLVAKAITVLSNHNIPVDECMDCIAEDLWTNLDVTRTWLRAGGSIHDNFPESMLNSKEFGLLVAEYCGLHAFLQKVPLELRSDKEFIMEAVGKDSTMFLGAAGDLNRDFEVAEAAFGGTTSQTQVLVETFVSVGRETPYFEFLRAVLNKSRHGLNAYDGFVKGLLCGMSVDAGARCNLRTLERGAETALAWKKLIAEYACVPTGTKLRLLRRVARNLEYLDNYNSDDNLDEDSDEDSDND
jgi:Domain of unknown function (DUF4116)